MLTRKKINRHNSKNAIVVAVQLENQHVSVRGNEERSESLSMNKKNRKVKKIMMALFLLRMIYNNFTLNLTRFIDSEVKNLSVQTKSQLHCLEHCSRAVDVIQSQSQSLSLHQTPKMTNAESQHQVIKTEQSEQSHGSSSGSNKNSKNKKSIRMKDAVPTNNDLFTLRDQANLKSKMSISDTTEALCFSEKNVTEFIRVMDTSFHKFFIETAQKKLKCLADYSSEAVLSFYDTTSDFHDGNYEKICWKLKKHYAKEDKAQQINNLHWLKQFINIH